MTTSTHLYELADDLEARGMYAEAQRVIECARDARRLEKFAAAQMHEAHLAASVPTVRGHLGVVA